MAQVARARSETELGDRLFDPSAISTEYQPIVDLASGNIVGTEALARWPGTSITPDFAFAEARVQNRVRELDTLCQKAAIAGTIGVALPPGFKVFVNVEPGNSVAALTRFTSGLEVVAEITERAIFDNPSELLRSVREMREMGCGIALDDVGAVPDSLALMPFLAPDVIKLDLSLVQRWPNAEQARIVTAVAAHAERSGAVVLAEGIETPEHLQQALALGATLGQGWLFSREGPIVAGSIIEHPIALRSPPPVASETPFGLLDPARLKVGTKGMLLSISRHLEQQGMSLQTPPLVLAAFQDRSRFTFSTARRYRDLAVRCPLVVALGAGMSAEPIEGVRGTHLDADDHLLGEWTVVVVGMHYTGALIAQDLGDAGPDLDRRFQFVLTHDYEMVVAVARILLGRVDPRDSRSAASSTVEPAALRPTTKRSAVRPSPHGDAGSSRSSSGRSNPTLCG